MSSLGDNGRKLERLGRTMDDDEEEEEDSVEEEEVRR